MVWVKRAAVVVGILLVAYGVYRGRTILASRQQSNAAPTFATVKVSQGPVDLTVSDPGTISATVTDNVNAQVGGAVQSVDVKVGQMVKKGEVLATLEDTQGLGAAVTSAKASLAQAEAQLQTDLNPGLNTSPTQLANAKLQVKQAQLNLQQEQSAIAKLNVTAPFSGQVLQVNVVPGESVGAGTALLSFADNAQTWAVVQVAENLLPDIGVGAKATVTVQGTGDTYDGSVSLIGNTPQAAGKGTGQTFPVTIVLSNPGSGLLGGMTAIASITPTSGTITQPISATGVIGFPTVTNVSAEQAGTVVTVPKVGAQVAAGQVLVTESSSSAQTQLKQDQLSLQTAENNLQALESPQPATAATIAAQRAQIASLQAALANKEKQYTELTITAPMAGQITAVNLSAGDAVSNGSVNAGTTIVTIQSAGGLEALVPVDELDIAKVKVGQQVQIQVNALPGTNVVGKVAAVAPTAVASNGVSTYQVTVDVPATSGLLPGMSLTANIQVANVANAVRVPAEAVQSQGKRDIVFVPGPDGKPRPQPVKVGIVGTTWTQIVSGLQPGQTIIAAFAQSNTGFGGGRGPGAGAFFRAAGGGRRGN